MNKAMVVAVPVVSLALVSLGRSRAVHAQLTPAASASAPSAGPSAAPGGLQTAAPATAASGANHADVEALKQELAAVKKRLDEAEAAAATKDDVVGVQSDLENFKYQYQRERETKSTLSTRNLTVGGIVQVRFSATTESLTTPTSPNYAQTSVNNPAQLHKRQTSFAIPNAILSFGGLLYRDYEAGRNLSFLTSVAASAATSNYGAGLANTNNFLTVLDANLTYNFLPTLENDGARLSLTAGQQLVPFGLEGNTTEELRPVIVNALFLGPTGFNLRQIGLVAKGEFFTQYDFGYNYRQALISAAVGILNGNGPNRDDDNGIKDVVGRVAITVPATYNSWLRELRFGASGYWGRVNLVDQNSAYVGPGDRQRLGADVYYNHWPFGCTYEFAWLKDESAASAARVTQYRNGHTATVFYSFGQQFLTSIKTQGKYDDWWPKTFQPFFRLDTFVADTHTHSRNQILTAGLNIYFAETTKFQLNGNFRRQQVPSKPTVESGEVLAQFQYGF